MTIQLLGRLCAVLLACAVAPLPVSAETPVATTRSGQVSGLEADGVTAFKGIPYAAPPVGPLRWRAPQPPEHWAGVRPATEFGLSCMQDPDPRLGVDASRLGEDCLTLNVWSPPHRPGERLAVMVMIPGGGFFGGGSAAPFQYGGNLAARGIVVVSLNYRLGVFGFLAHPGLSGEARSGTSGAYGLLDQIAALKWVRANIAAFGGDPAKVTIMGESAGGSSVLYLMASPLAKGLFRAAISESAGRVWFPMQHLKSSAYALTSAEAEGSAALGGDLSALRSQPARELQVRAHVRTDLWCSDAGVDFWPIVDGAVLPDDPARLFATGRIAHVPLLVGSNADEGSLFALDCTGKTAADWRALVARRYPPAARLMLAQYPAGTDAEFRASIPRWITDWAFAGGARAAARSMSARNQAAYLYEFTRVNPKILPVPNAGSFHGMEVPYVFGNLAGQPGRDNPYDAADRALSDSMEAAWVRFVRTGDPNGPGLPKWPRYDVRHARLMEFGDKPAVRGVRDPVALDNFDKGFANLEGNR